MRSRFLFAGWIVLALIGCTINSVSVGSDIDEDRMSQIVLGQWTKADVLRVFGAPSRILRHREGDILVYEFMRRETRTLKIEEPVITNFELFTYSRSDEREDRLVVLFDQKGLVESFGFVEGTEDLE